MSGQVKARVGSEEKGTPIVVHVHEHYTLLKRCVSGQVKVRVGSEEKGTAAAEGLEEPGWAEVLEFAVSGEMTSNPDEEIVVRVWDHHWVRLYWACPTMLCVLCVLCMLCVLCVLCMLCMLCSCYQYHAKRCFSTDVCNDGAVHVLQGSAGTSALGVVH